MDINGGVVTDSVGCRAGGPDDNKVVAVIGVLTLISLKKYAIRCFSRHGQPTGRRNVIGNDIGENEQILISPSYYDAGYSR